VEDTGGRAAEVDEFGECEFNQSPASALGGEGEDGRERVRSENASIGKIVV